MSRITNEQKQHVIDIGKLVWENLTEEEQNRYSYDIGTYEFVDNIMLLLGINENQHTLDEFERIYDQIFESNLKSL